MFITRDERWPSLSGFQSLYSGVLGLRWLCSRHSSYVREGKVGAAVPFHTDPESQAPNLILSLKTIS